MAREAKLLIIADNLAKAAIKDAQGDLSGFEAAAKKVGDTLKSAFAVSAIVAVGKQITQFGIQCVQDFGGVERSMIQLRTALGGSESSFTRMSALIDEMAGKTLSSKDEVEALVAELASLGKSDADIDKLTRASVALANVTGDSLDGAMKKLLSAQEGQIRGLKVLIPEVGNLTKEQLAAGGAADILNAKFGAISDAMAGGIAQTFSNIGKSVEDLKENLGENLAPAFGPMITFINSVIDGWNNALAAHANYKRALVEDPVLAGMLKTLSEKEKALRDYTIRAEAAAGDATGMLSGNIDPERERRLRASLAAQLRIVQEYQLKAKGLTGLEWEPVPLVALPSAATGAGTSAPPGAGTSGPQYPAMYAPGATDVSAPADKLLGNIVEAQGKLKDLETSSFSFADAWSSAVDRVSERFQSWNEFASNMIASIADGLGNAFAAMGEALASGEDAWAGFGQAAVQALAGVLKALGAQLAALAVTNLLAGKFVSAGLATAGATAAYLAAGAASSWAGSMGGGSSSSSSSSSSSASAPSGGAVYTGAQEITFNFYNQGNVVGSGGLKELAYLLRDILKTDGRYA